MSRKYQSSSLDGIDIVCIPSFVEVLIDGQERTAVRLG
ncbi:MAG: stage V sporulation protein S, partial [Spirochaetota bacterium]|nr:stage V sporulation protein S [Spirochaetota bacterium]